MKKYIILIGAVLLTACAAVGEAVPANAGTELPALTTMEKLTTAESEPFFEETPAETEKTELVSETEVPTETVTETKITEGQAVPVESISLSTYSVTLRVGESKMPIVTMFPENASDKGEVWTSSDSAVATVNELGNITAVSEGSCTVTVTSAQNNEVSAEVEVRVTAAPQVTYIDGILVVNKTYALPADYGSGIDPEAQRAFDTMQADASALGLNIYISSGYRSYDYQAGLYRRYAERDGAAAADRYSARAGHSEHQTGLAFDLNTITDEFRDTAEGKWVAENCAEYGFIIRYPDGKEDVTGYMSEPWHIRYLGVDTAKAVYESGLCLEEYLGITSVYADT